MNFDYLFQYDISKPFLRPIVEYAFTPTYPILTLYVDCSLNHLLKILLHSIFSSGKILKSHQQVCVLGQYY